MARKLPLVSGREAVKAFEKVAWVTKRRRSSHITLTTPEMRYNLSVPDFPQLKRGTLRSLIRKAGLAIEEFVQLL